MHAKFRIPELLLNSKLISTKAAFFYWDSRNINLVSNSLSKQAIKSVTKRINGGTNGLPDREERFYKIFKILREKNENT